MDSLQVQITTLNRRTERLYEIIERLSVQIAELLAERTFAASSNGNYRSFDGISDRTRSAELGMLDAMMEHKDVLMDGNYLDTHATGDKELSSQVQIQRLTAQLTAAYNRIAALEEQLLSRRVH